MSQINQDVDLRKMIVFTLAADVIIKKVEELNLTANDILVLKMSKETTYSDMTELVNCIHDLFGDRKKAILAYSNGVSFETMTTEELEETKNQIELLLESRNG